MGTGSSAKSPADRGGARSVERTGASGGQPAYPPRRRRPTYGQPEGGYWYLREHGITLTWDVAAGILHASTAAVTTITGKASQPGSMPIPKGGGKRTPVARHWREPAPGDNPACPETGSYGE